MTEKVPVNLISAAGRIRGLTESTVEALMGSIADVGLLNPVTLCRTTIYRSGEKVDGYGLVAGAHRLEACRRLGLTDIEATIVDLDEPHRIIAECDENLCGPKLSAVEEAEFTARRKWAYEQLHPETTHGGDRRSSRHSDDLKPASEANRFTADTAARTGKSEATVQRAAARGRKICDQALSLAKGTHLDKRSYLDQLLNMPADAQVERVKADLKEPPKPKAEAPKAAPLPDIPPAPQANDVQSADLGGPAWAVQEFRRLYDELREDSEENDPDQPFTLHQYALDMCGGSTYPHSEMAPILLALLGLSRDPWPGLTKDDINRMINGRVKEAERRGIHALSFEPGIHEKLVAAVNRSWLEEGRAPKACRRGAPAEDAEVVA